MRENAQYKGGTRKSLKKHQGKRGNWWHFISSVVVMWFYDCTPIVHHFMYVIFQTLVRKACRDGISFEPLLGQQIVQSKFAASVPSFVLSLFGNGIKLMLAQELIGTSKICSGTTCCPQTNLFLSTWYQTMFVLPLFTYNCSHLWEETCCWNVIHYGAVHQQYQL